MDVIPQRSNTNATKGSRKKNILKKETHAIYECRTDQKWLVGLKVYWNNRLRCDAHVCEVVVLGFCWGQT